MKSVSRENPLWNFALATLCVVPAELHYGPLDTLRYLIAVTLHSGAFPPPGGEIQELEIWHNTATLHKLYYHL